MLAAWACPGSSCAVDSVVASAAVDPLTSTQAMRTNLHVLVTYASLAGR